MIERYGFGANLDPNGHFTGYRNVACEEWRTEKPDRPDALATQTWRILLDYGIKNQQLGYYWDGAFRYANGANIRVPNRWAYLRLAEERWDGARFLLPDGSAHAPTPALTTPIPALDNIMAGVMKLYTPRQIQDSMDRRIALDAPGAPLG